jgi:hypothetical protein
VNVDEALVVLKVTLVGLKTPPPPSLGVIVRTPGIVVLGGKRTVNVLGTPKPPDVGPVN